MEYSFQQNAVIENKSCKYQLFWDDSLISFSTFLQLLEQDKSFRLFFIDLLSNIPFRAYHWETPPITQNTVSQPFEFVTTRSPGIDLPPDSGPFQQYFHSGQKVAVFDNLGGDAKLIAPISQGDHQPNYSHIGVFTENAPRDLQQSLWQTVGRVTRNSISDQPLWLNTAGGGVSWLHVRLDSRPKYYRYHPYTTVKS